MSSTLPRKPRVMDWIALALVAAYPLGLLVIQGAYGGFSARCEQVLLGIASAGWLVVCWRVWSGRWHVPVVATLGLAALVRLALFSAPVGDDVYRYVWEGRVWLAGQNPYVLAPNDPRLAGLRDADWERVNHPYHAAIYPPTAELLFAGLAALGAGPSEFRIALAGAEFLGVLLLARALRSTPLGGGAVALYAFSPLALFSVAREGHVDGLVVLGAGLVFWSLRIGAALRWRSALLAGLGLGVAAGAKWVSLLALPWLGHVCARRASQQQRRWPGWVAAAAVGSALLTLALPALGYVSGGEGPFSMLGPLRHFASNYRHLDAGQQLLAQVLSHEFVPGAARSLVLLTAVCVAIAAPRPALAWLVIHLMLIVLAPTIHPWYLVWILPSLCFVRYWPAAILAASMIFAREAECVLEATGHWRQPAWTVWAVFTPFFTAVLVDGLIRMRGVLRRPAPQTAANARGGR